MTRARLWDAPTRVVHWALVVVLGFSWWTAETDRFEWHAWSGYTALGLLIFRILWGFIGSSTARFSSFVKGPGTTLAYLRTLPARGASITVGHNPLGALSVLAILLSLTIQVVAGLFAVDVDGFETGPLSYLVSFDQGRLAAKIHAVNFTVLQVLAALHVAAIAFYLLYKRTNLVGPMLTGRRRFEAEPQGLAFARWHRVLIAAAVAFVLMAWISKGLKLG